MNKKQYNYIRAWGQYMGYYPYYIRYQISLARKGDAPDNAIFECGDSWRTVSDIHSQRLRETIMFMADSISEFKAGKV